MARNYRNYTDQEVKEAIKKSISWRETASKLGLSNNSGSAYGTLRKIAKKNNFDFSHFKGQGYLKGKTHNFSKATPLEKIMIKNSTYNRGDLKRRLLKNGMLENKCYICGQLPEHNNKELVMVLDHINGVNNDNREENLRLLCPNCNSQQKTFAGRNAKKEKKKYLCKKCSKKISRKSKSGLCVQCVKEYKVKNRPSKDILLKEVEEHNYCIVGRRYGVSDNCIRKWLK